MTIHWITAQRDAASDDGLLVARVLTQDSSAVRVGDPIFEVEGSKSLFEVSADAQGTFFSFVEEGDFVDIGDVLACICSAGEDRPKRPTPGSNAPANTYAGPDRDRFSDAAWEIVCAQGLDPTKTRTDLNFVTALDVPSQAALSPTTPLEIPEGKTRVALLGGSYGAILAFDAIRDHESLALVGVFDDQKNFLEDEGIPVLGNLQRDFINSYANDWFDACIIVVQADMQTRTRLRYDCITNGIPLETVIHPRASVSSLASIGAGCLVMDLSRVGPYATLKDNVFVSGMVNIDHHCEVGADATFGPGVFLSGGVHVDDQTSFGTSIGVESHVKIGRNCKVTSGSIIHKDVPDDTVVKVASQVNLRSHASRS